MRVIQITEKKLDELFERTLEKLKLDSFTNRKCRCEKIVGLQPMGQLHRSFHYHVSVLKDAIKDS